MIEITKADQSDTDAIVEILEDARLLKLQLNDESWGYDPFTADEISTSVEQGDTYVARCGQEYIGTFVLMWSDITWGAEGNDSEAAYIHLLATANSVRGQRIGEQIIQLIGGLARNQGKQYVRLDCYSANEMLKDYYKRLGFVELRVAEPNPNNPYYTASLLQKDIQEA